MFSEFWKKLNNYKEQVSNFETNLTNEGEKFSIIMERNAVLEKEIEERTNELKQANKSILTLKHIWSTMNSDEPLNATLSTIAQGMTNDLGYESVIIFQVFGEDENKYLKIRETSQNEKTKLLLKILDKKTEEFFIPMNADKNLLIQAISKEDIIQLDSLEEVFEYTNFKVTQDIKNNFEKMLVNKAISVIPIVFQEKVFGCLLVISPRSDITDTEKNFLSMFAKQIELSVTIADLFQTIKEQAITDGLTTLYNRRHFDTCLKNESNRSLRLNQPFTLITLDLDHLKTINDSFGHSAGDAAIVGIAKILKKNARAIDIPSRFGGEEFGVVLPGIDIEGGLKAAERLRAAIESTPVEGVGQITASIGIGTFLRHSSNLEEFIELVDQAMYRAKRNGRNQVQIAQAWDSNIWKRQALDALIHILSRQMMPISKELADDLIEKLKNTNLNDKNVDDIIFLVVDEFVNIYKPYYQRGNIKDKLELIVSIAKKLDVSQEEIDKFKIAALVYDIGNIMIPEDILLKDGPLNENEKERIRNNPINSAKEILAPVGTASNIIALLENWNEHYDGSGNPGKIKGDDIPLGTAILVVVNVYFALISPRPYRQAFSKKEALKILQDGAKKKWNPKVVEMLKKSV